jgi:serine/alanine adding enzyme
LDGVKRRILHPNVPQDRALWNEIGNHIDVYYTAEYASLFADVEDGVARAYLFEDGAGNLVLYPFVCRELSALEYLGEQAGDLLDIITPYGYGGPVYVGSDGCRATVMRAFRRSFHQYSLDESIVAEFVRYHPLLRNHLYEDDSVDTTVIRTTVTMQVAPDEHTAMDRLPAKTRNMVRRAVGAGVTVEAIPTPGSRALEDFVRLYDATMARRHADPFYFFSAEVVRGIFQRMPETATLFVAYSRDGTPVSGALVLRGGRDGRYIHYHLAGSDPDQMPPGTNNLLIFRAAIWGASVGATEFHLGGGYSEGDSLFRFKSGMSRERRGFAIGRVIHSQYQYDRLVSIARTRVGERDSSGFFPLYRVGR